MNVLNTYIQTKQQQRALATTVNLTQPYIIGYVYLLYNSFFFPTSSAISSMCLSYFVIMLNRYRGTFENCE